MSCSLSSLEGVIYGKIIEPIKGETRSLDIAHVGPHHSNWPRNNHGYRALQVDLNVIMLGLHSYQE